MSQPLSAAPDASLHAHYRRFIWRRLALLIALGVAVAALLVVNVMTGPAQLPMAQVVWGILAPADLSPALRVIIWDVRLPFAAMALCVGAALGLAGAEMQTALNNPLASPSTLGVMHAATLGAALVIVFKLSLGGIPEAYLVALAAFVAAMIAVFTLQGVARLLGASGETVVLFGIALVFVLDALISLIQFVADSDSLQQIVFWTMGSLARATWEKVSIVALVLIACMMWSLRHVWMMTSLRGGEDYAKSYGVPVERLRLQILLRVSLLTAAAVAFTGVIGFVGLVGPHIARMAFGEDHRFYIPGSALAGALILSGASIASKSLIPGVLIPDGIVTALIGIPLFVGLLITQRRRTGWSR